jgi:hypothetical protein
MSDEVPDEPQNYLVTFIDPAMSHAVPTTPRTSGSQERHEDLRAIMERAGNRSPSPDLLNVDSLPPSPSPPPGADTHAHELFNARMQLREMRETVSADATVGEQLTAAHKEIARLVETSDALTIKVVKLETLEMFHTHGGAHDDNEGMQAVINYQFQHHQRARDVAVELQVECDELERKFTRSRDDYDLAARMRRAITKATEFVPPTNLKDVTVGSINHCSLASVNHSLLAFVNNCLPCLLLNTHSLCLLPFLCTFKRRGRCCCAT